MGITASYVTRVVERSIRESDTMDTESLCIVAGEKVWCINCDIRLLSYDGNALDACTLATVNPPRDTPFFASLCVDCCISSVS